MKPDPARILVVDDEPANVDVLHRCLEAAGYAVLVATDGPQALRAAARARPHLVVLDVMMPEMSGFDVCRRLKQEDATRAIPVIFVTGRDDMAARLEGFRAGGVDYIQKPFEEAEVLARVRAQVEIARLGAELTRNNLELERRMAELRAEMARREQAEEAKTRADARAAAVERREAERWDVAGFIGKSATLARILDEVHAIQESHTVSVLITGESGTGKELIARALHFGSSRAHQPFVPVNCTAIPSELAESALFGHVKGAFSGASEDHRGYFEEADGGTLFLDEIGDMPLALQPKLLRALEERRIRPVGGTGERAVDVRVVAATNCDPADQLARGLLRQDLYFRIARVPIRVPPLRDRRDDIPLLARHFLDLFATEMRLPSPDISAEALACLDAYAFPGNVRELKNMMEYALLRSRGQPITAGQLNFLDVRAVGQPGAGTPQPEPEAVILAHVRQNGSIANAECRELLGVSHRRATYLLGEMVRAGQLDSVGERRWNRYVLAGSSATVAAEPQ